MIKDYFPNQEEDNIIVLDTNYSPVKLVNSQVDKVVVDLTKEEEILTLTIDTNGAIEPSKALHQALEITQSSFNYLSKLIGKKKETKSSDEVVTKKEKSINPEK